MGIKTKKKMSESTRESRERQIKKAIKLIGWFATFRSIKTPEDRKIFNKLSEEQGARTKAEQDEELKQAGISF